ncbi:MAG: histidine kinase [Gammaproteobacteria bacterium]
MASIPHDASIAADESLSENSARQPNALLYGLWSLFCAILIVVALRDYFRSGGSELWKPLLWEGSSVLYASVLFVLERTAGRRYASLLDNPSRWFGQHLKWLPLVAIGFVPVVYGVRHAVYALVGDTYTHESWAFVIPYEAIKLSLFIGLWLGVIFSFDSFVRWQAQQQRLLELQRALLESRLSQLSSQLRPHFFFNALNTISALMHIDVARADRLLARLGDLLRASLEPTGQNQLPLREEVRLLDLYAQIMLERFADRVTVAWRVDDAALNVAVPAMLLQPLLENAFKHAVERGRSKVSIEIAAFRNEGRLVLAVKNTGSRLPQDFLEGVGLRNCRERLRVIHGDAASLRLTENGDAVEADVTLPWREHAQ